MLRVIMLSVIMLSVINAECRVALQSSDILAKKLCHCK
jgi:hypothetical protein